jgi:hypothetical protein
MCEGQYNRCDFCSSRDVRYTFPTKDCDLSINLPIFGSVVVGRSVGPWVACEECALLIDQGRKEMLLYRAVEAILTALGPNRPAREDAEASIHESHAMFWANRSGEKEEVRR